MICSSDGWMQQQRVWRQAQFDREPHAHRCIPRVSSWQRENFSVAWGTSPPPPPPPPTRHLPSHPPGLPHPPTHLVIDVDARGRWLTPLCWVRLLLRAAAGRREGGRTDGDVEAFNVCPRTMHACMHGLKVTWFLRIQKRKPCVGWDQFEPAGPVESSRPSACRVRA
jgi:hypothetical protein